MHSLMLRRTAKDAAVSCALLISVSVRDQSSQRGSRVYWASLWSAPLLLVEYRLLQGNNCPVTPLSSGGKALASCCVNTLLVFATASSAGVSRKLQEMGRNHVFHFLASLFSATEHCKSKNVNASPACVKKRHLGIMKIFCFMEEKCSKLVTYF